MTPYSYPYRLLCGASVNATVINNTPCYLDGIFVGSLNDAPIYIFVYDTAGLPNANSVPVAQFLIPANATPANGAGSNISFLKGMQLVNGLALRVTKDIASTGTTALDASEVPITFLWSKD